MEATQPATEDIVIPNTPKKPSKLPLILLIAVAALVAVGVGGWALVRSLGGSGNSENNNAINLTPAEAFEQYRTYMSEGNGGVEITDSSDWLLYQLRSSSFSLAGMEEYVNEINNKYSIFLSSASNSAKSDPELDIDRYGRLLELFEKSGSLRVLRQNVLTKFIESGAQGAYDYIVEITPVQPENEENRIMIAVSKLIGEYLDDELTLIEIYQNWGCIESDGISMSCVDDYINNTYQEVFTDQSSAYQTIIDYTAMLQTAFTSMTEAITNKLGSA